MSRVGRRRLRLVAVAVALAGIFLGARAAQLSIVDFQEFQALAAEGAAGGQERVEERGDILTADGRQLATSLPASRVVATPYQIEEPAEVAAQLEDVLGPETGMAASGIEEKLTTKNGSGELAGYSPVAEGIGPEVAREIETLGIEGISTDPDGVRTYPHEDLASQLTGHLGGYGEAFGGIEGHHDKTLEGGEDVSLTLDAAVQQELESSLEEAVGENGAEGAQGLVMRVDDGSIVALANSPGYDNNNYEESSPEEQRNRVLTDPYEPGSTFKAFTLAAALEEGSITQETGFVVPDSIKVADRTINDSEEHETERMTPEEILAESSNVGTVKVAQELGGEALAEHTRDFGFGEPTGVDLYGEDAGNVPAYRDWSGSSIGNIPIGQGLTATPLQLAAGYATLANGGFRVTPHIEDSAGSEGRGERVISRNTSDIVRGMLQTVVDDGTGQMAQIPGYSVAGKTGTSQKVDQETGTYGGGYIVSFAGFAPADDPEYVTLIVVDDPQESIWGEVVAAPAFQKVMSFTLSYSNVVPDRPGREAREPAQPQETAAAGETP